MIVCTRCGETGNGRCKCERERKPVTPEFHIDPIDKTLTFGVGENWAVFCPDEMWYPCRYFDDGNMDIWDIDGGFLKPSTAYKMSKVKFT